jgi:hypothetical protein
MNNYNIKYLFKNTKTPLLLLVILLNNKSLKDSDLEIIFKCFFYVNGILPLKYNLFMILNKKKYNKTIILTKNYYNIVNNQIKIIPFIKKIKKSFPYKYFWNKDIDSQIHFLKNKLNIFLSYYDCSKGYITFMIKLRIGYKNISLKQIENEMIDRLLKTKNLFKLHFFKNNEIILISLDIFLELTYENKIKYLDYIFSNCLKRILSYINYLELYNLYRLELINLLNLNSINIIESNDNIDFTLSDIEF